MLRNTLAHLLAHYIGSRLRNRRSLVRILHAPVVFPPEPTADMAGSLDFTRAISIKYQLKYTGVLPNGTYSGNPMYGNETCTSGTTWNYTAGWPIIQFNVPRCYVFIDPKNVTKIYMFASYYCKPKTGRGAG